MAKAETAAEETSAKAKPKPKPKAKTKATGQRPKPKPQAKAKGKRPKAKARTNTKAEAGAIAKPRLDAKIQAAVRVWTAALLVSETSPLSQGQLVDNLR